jgi:hypothetical protein
MAHNVWWTLLNGDSMNSQKSINDLCWHDGRLLGISILYEKNSGYSITFKFSLLESLESQARNEHVLTLFKVSKLTSDFDLAQMSMNFNFGNVANFKCLQESPTKIFLYLTEGYISAACDSFEMKLEKTQ